MTPLGVMSQLTQCAYIGLAGAPPPRPPHRDTAALRRGSGAPSMRPSLGRAGRMMSAGRFPGVRQPRSPPAVNPLARVLRSAPALRVTAAADRAGRLLRASRKAGPRSGRTSGAPCAAPLSRRAGTEATSSTAGPTPDKLPSSSAHGPQRTGHGGGSRVRGSPTERHEPRRRDRRRGEGAGTPGRIEKPVGKALA